ncbi:MAG TPA: aminotransferase class V-fold PLP-dependent enzyme [Acidimicrobiia bacterium]|nr:aminotransferase class V-fold PLP-dependent enzyme [Acidimicrobiia bacterium]
MDLIARVRQSVIGRDTAVRTPFGLRRVTYADYTASGRSLTFIEDYLRSHVLPLYANTHTETSGTGLQTTRFREEAREIVRRCVGANRDEHAVIFAGSGSTGAIDRLISILGLRIPAGLDDRYHLTDLIPADERPVVFVGPYEHHSNELPWRESIADVVEIAEDADGHIDLADLEHRLIEHAGRPLRIGSFSAASNVTGIISDTTAISSMLHRHGALSFWDFAAAAPYVGIEMRSSHTHGHDYKDAIFLSPHKFIGGPGTPGVLVVRRDLLTNRVPAVPGGGTVAYVNPEEHRYLADPEHREEGGTPAIVESIRCGLVFKLKEEVGAEEIRRREEVFIRRAIAAWQHEPNVRVLGNPEADRLSIVSFVIRHGDRYLHHNYVVALLNDLFGIQARGGCSCAGPYGHRLLGIDLDTSHRYETEIARGCEVIKPGWVRVNFNYFIDDDEFTYIVDAVRLVARLGWAMLPHYEFDVGSGTWRHRDGVPTPPMSLDAVSFRDGAPVDGPLTAGTESYPEYLAEAERLLTEAAAAPPPCDSQGLEPTAEELRWFPVGTEIR